MQDGNEDDWAGEIGSAALPEDAAAIYMRARRKKRCMILEAWEGFCNTEERCSTVRFQKRE